MPGDYVERTATTTVVRLLKQFPIVGILGARQVGKSTLAKGLGGGWRTFDLERAQDREVVERDPELFLERNPAGVVIDEAQELPELFPALRVAVDARRNDKGRFVITGSSSPVILDHITETLAGRIGLVELGTLTASERWRRKPSDLYGAIDAGIDVDRIASLTAGLTSEQVLRSWIYGGYPEPVLLDDAKSFRIWIDNYRATYLQRDVRRLFPRLDHDAFRRCLAMLARLSGTIVNRAELARALSVSEPTVSTYLDIAHGTFVWRNLQSYTKDVVKRVMKMPRGHYRDTGLLHGMLNLSDADAVFEDPIAGRSWETFVIEEILSGLEYALVPHDAYYYRTKSGAEIDLIVEGHFGTLPIEIKLGTKVDGRELRTLKEFVAERDLPLGLVINNAERVDWLAERILRVPATLL